MVLVPLGVAGERGLVLLTGFVTLICLLAFATISQEVALSRFAYDPSGFHIGRMLSSAFMHGGVGHLLGNLFFFVPFAASVERRTNSIAFAAAFVFIALAESVAYFLVSQQVSHPLLTIGLSGVVWGFMGVSLFLCPKARLDCYFFYIVGGRRVEVPNWIFVLGFLAWEILSYGNQPTANTNYVAHFAGFAAGAVARFLLKPWANSELEPWRRAREQ